MSLSDFFSPVDSRVFNSNSDFLKGQLGGQVQMFSDNFPEINKENADIVIFGVLDDRGAVNNQGCGLAPDYVREKLYSLYQGTVKVKIADLGNIKSGHTVADTYAAVKTVVTELVKEDIFPLIIGGGQDITYAQYMAYEELEQKVDLVVIDSKFDLDDSADTETTETNSSAYLNKIFLHQPNYLFNFSNIGYQTYFVNQESLRIMDKLLFDANRLGDFYGRIAVSEPVIRNANMISFDISAIRSSDACGNANATPNGFYGEEACQLCRYAGMNDKLTSFGVYEYNPAYDQNGQTAMLIAQMLWYLIDGYYQRKKDFPLQPKSQYLIYRATLKDNSHELVFVKSKKTDRWWMQVPYPTSHSGNERYHLVPCRYDDYQLAVGGEMPDLWWRTYQKLV
ncbi:formimidoylglutamase [Pararcticibacter amylolyticus]|uniref:Arginase n=1 Tax=Pararcticibacter amylolyticus TaxID=2173175 RepID=A0A2U2PDP2_9SPHI|nr:formimidoylglutamase [Pararcticibacter amylolyticus]PWG79506.1 arginase [Pararcticibacter amylolyticus]